jgi:hypothetical protein
VPCLPQMPVGNKMLWPTQTHTIQRVGSLYSDERGLHWKLTIEICKSMLFCYRVRPGWSPVPCLPQMGQEMVWPTQRHTMQRFGGLHSVRLGLHWKLTTHKTIILQTNAFLLQSQTRVVTTAPVCPRWARKWCGPPKDIPYSVLAACIQ